MATLLDEEFLADLDDLSDDEPAEKAKAQDGEDEEEDTFGMDIEGLNYDDLSTHAKLTSSDRYQDIMQRVRAMRADDATKGSGSDSGGDAAAVAPSWRGPSNEEPAYRLLVECNQLAVDIDNEIAIMHNYLRDRFRPRFPELQELVQTPIEYSRVVRRIGNQMDITDVELDDLLPAATVMVVTVTASTTNGKPLAPEELQRVHQTCDMAEQLDQDKLEILRFVESRMSSIAPNLTKVLGSEIAAKLMGLAGGLLQLSQIPACNIKVLGQKRRNLAGYSAATAGKHQGYVYDCDLVQNSPKALREKVQRLVANKITLVARFDAYGRDPAGAKGEEFRAEIVKTIERWQEPPPAKTSKPLPKPDAESKKRRGGRRLRKMKERYGLTEMRKAANRVEFNKQEEEVMDGDDVVGLGMLGQNSGRLRIVAAQQKVKLNRKSQAKVRARSLGGGSGATSGLSSSLAFTPVQGIELENPSAHLGNSDAVADRADGTESYFSDLSGFRSLAAKPK